MLRNIVKSRFTKILSVFLAINFLIEILAPNMAFALTGGPSQPEVQSFEPIGTSEMVDIFSGDYTYNLALCDVGGYPINISYNAGATADDEASLVGLRWNLNVGAINRSMRALPDDFNGEEIEKEFSMKPNLTYGLNLQPLVEFFGVDPSLKFNFGLSYNNFKGVGFEAGINPEVFSSGDKTKGKFTGSLGVNASSESGFGIQPNLSYEREIEKKEEESTLINSYSSSLGLDFSSRGGLKSLNFGIRREQTRRFEFEVTDINGKKETKSISQFLGGKNGGGSISFASSSYTPQISMPMINTNISFKASLGSEALGFNFAGKLKGYFSGQWLAKKSEKLPAYGYLYSHNAKSDSDPDKVMLDFNREKDGSFTKKKPNLPVTNFTYDIYTVVGQGIGGMYRPFRSDIGIVYDSKVENVGGGGSFPGIEAGFGNSVKVGSDFNVNFSHSQSGRWKRTNGPAEELEFKGGVGDPLYEPVYFAQAGERTAETDEAFYQSIGEDDPVAVDIDKRLLNTHANKRFLKDNGTSISITSDNFREHRRRRNQSISYLTADLANNFALEKKIRDYNFQDFSLDTDGNYQYSNIDRTQGASSGHLSEITTLRPDGARYVFGIPAYNKKQDEVTFAVEAPGNCKTGLVDYTPLVDDSENNDNGLDHFYSKTSMPPFAYAYMLTAVLSPDYIDVNDNGPDELDYGTYTKFNYSKAVPDYKWRVPYQVNKASYSEGLRSQGNDDKGSYIYGEKDIWYIHSIETKTHVAEFELADRRDAYEVQGTQGGSGNRSMKLLKEIRLYSKQDKKLNPSDAKPIKTIHFVYDYSLCPGVPNNDGQLEGVDIDGNPPANPEDDINYNAGKLTLRKVFFTYNNSFKGKLSPYVFHYADADHDGVMEPELNPGYNLKSYDRWGNYKPNVGNCGPDGPPVNSDFPYTEQDKDKADMYAKVWNLSFIDLPSGGRIEVEYESDDYAYVQDKRAMQMFKVTGMASEVPMETGDLNLLSNNELYSGTKENVYAFIELSPDDQDQGGITTSEFKRRYLTGHDGKLIEHLYFKFFMDLTAKKKKNEFVAGYARIDYNAADAYGVVFNGTHAWVRLKKVKIEDLIPAGVEVNPIAQATWNFTKVNIPHIAYNQSNVESNGFLQILEAMGGTLTAVAQFLTGFNKFQRLSARGKRFNPERSMIRLYNPDFKKLGGGHRVKKITISDRWADMVGSNAGTNFQYGQEYKYTTTNALGEEISSGVAAYEPMIGGDENPFRRPVFYEEKNTLAPNDRFYVEKPYGETFFPGASVGYSNVEVRNLKHTNVNRNATGRVIHQFYTARDYPTQALETRLNPLVQKSNPLFKFLKIRNIDFITASQGYSIIRNNMHGQQRKQLVYPEDENAPISGVEYFYKSTAEYKEGQRNYLDNTVTVIEKNSTSGSRVRKAQVGVDYDFVVDMREQRSVTINGGAQGNLDAFLAAVLPFALPVVLPELNSERTRFRSAVTTKVIDQYAILEKVVALDLGSEVSTKNMAYDAETGEVLLTQTINEYNDSLYSFTYPAHWSYDGMGPAYRNVGATFVDTKLSDFTSPEAYFIPGDELLLKDGSGSAKGWVTEVDGGLIVVNEQGIKYNDNTSYNLIRILRSGRRNQQTTPVGTVTCMNNPLIDLNNDQEADDLLFEGQTLILNAGAVEFTDTWQQFCNCDAQVGNVVNPYLAGTRGNWRAKRSLLHLTEREQTYENRNVNIRRDGAYTDFTPFWSAPTTTPGDWDAADPAITPWQFTSEVTLINPRGGVEAENVDPLGRYSSALYGYNHTLPVAVASNSRYREIAFDSFEDYNFRDCIDNHFSYRNEYEQDQSVISKDEYHTGRRSITVKPYGSVKLRKSLSECGSGGGGGF